MAIHLTTLTLAQIHSFLALADRVASKVDGQGGTTTKDLLMNEDIGEDLQALVAAIDKLSAPAKNELMTLIWLGMGTIGEEQSSWAELLHAVQEVPINDIPEEIAMLPNLAEYLHRGLEKVG